MSILIVQTPNNNMVCKGSFLAQIQLHKSPDLSNRMKQSIKNLKVGEAIKFPNGLKVKLIDGQMVESLVAYIKRRNMKDRKHDTKHTNI